MKKRLTAAVLAAVMLSGIFSGAASYESLVENSIALEYVNETNYDKYIKPYKDEYGYNIGECSRAYLAHEEYFYSEYYDHWNVDTIYDASVIKSIFTDFEEAKPVIREISNIGDGIVLRWSVVKKASAYAVYRKEQGGSWKKLLNAEGNTFVDTSCENGKKYSYKVKALKKVKGKAVYSKKSAVKAKYRLKSVKVNKYINEEERKIRGYWYVNKCADGYQIKCCNDNVSRVKTISGTYSLSGYITGLTKGKTYDISIRCYKEVSGKKKYSAWSSVKSVKVKK